jgi:nitroimidazol reductase NimA-like FMN-containing flavoprotein (pyridoxamine 5'-phosphate oxidase superfamily)
MPIEGFIDSREWMERLLHEESVGYLGLATGGSPYVVPLNYAYLDGRILFHCALEGKKLDCLRANPEVCFTVGRQTGPVRRHAEGNPCHVDSDSVICYGRARIVSDLEERRRVLDEFNRCYHADAGPLSAEAAEKCCAVEIRIGEMTGREERERKRTYWKYRFRK